MNVNRKIMAEIEKKLKGVLFISHITLKNQNKSYFSNIYLCYRNIHRNIVLKKSNEI